VQNEQPIGPFGIGNELVDADLPVEIRTHGDTRGFAQDVERHFRDRLCNKDLRLHANDLSLVVLRLSANPQ
jgi:hypothetical protein